MVRLNPAAILHGHWKGLSMRSYRGGELVDVRPDHWARIVCVVVPACAALLVVLFPPRLDASSSLGLALAWAALSSSGLLGTFTLLASWRAKLSERAEREQYYKDKELPLRSLLDESVAHVLLGVLDSLALAAVAAVAFIVRGALALPAAALVGLLFAHTLVLFVIVTTRVYGAYTEAEDVPIEADGFVRASR